MELPESIEIATTATEIATTSRCHSNTTTTTGIDAPVNPADDIANGGCMLPGT